MVSDMSFAKITEGKQGFLATASFMPKLSRSILSSNICVLFEEQIGSGSSSYYPWVFDNTRVLKSPTVYDN